MNPINPSRRTFVCAAGLSALLIGARPAWAQGPASRKRVSIAVVEWAGFCNLPLVFAEQLGFFREEGLELEIHDFADPSLAMQALLGGSAQVVSGSYLQTLLLQTRGKICQAFVFPGRTPAVSVGMSMRVALPYRTVVGLKGMRIGIPGHGSPAHTAVKLILWRAGVAQGEVIFVDVPTNAEALDALRSGRIDAISYVDPTMTTLELKNEIRIIADTRTIQGSAEVFGGSMPGACLYASQDFIEGHARTAQALTDAVVRALKWLQTAGPRDLIKTLPEAFLQADPALYLSAFNKLRQSISHDGLMPEDGPLTALKTIARFEPVIQANRIDLAKTYTNEFARVAKARFRI